MTDTDITALSLLVTAVGTQIVNLVIALRTKGKVDTVSEGVAVAAVKRDLVSAKIEDVATRTSIIEGHVNSASSASIERVESLQRELASAKGMMAELQHQNSMFAQTVATQAAAASVPMAAIIPEKKG